MKVKTKYIYIYIFFFFEIMSLMMEEIWVVGAFQIPKSGSIL